jgi:hypothetical protein
MAGFGYAAGKGRSFSAVIVIEHMFVCKRGAGGVRGL